MRFTDRSRTSGPALSRAPQSRPIGDSSCTDPPGALAHFGDSVIFIQKLGAEPKRTLCQCTKCAKKYVPLDQPVVRHSTDQSPRVGASGPPGLRGCSLECAAAIRGKSAVPIALGIDFPTWIDSPHRRTPHRRREYDAAGERRLNAPSTRLNPGFGGAVRQPVPTSF